MHSTKHDNEINIFDRTVNYVFVNPIRCSMQSTACQASEDEQTELVLQKSRHFNIIKIIWNLEHLVHLLAPHSLFAHQIAFHIPNVVYNSLISVLILPVHRFAPSIAALMSSSIHYNSPLRIILLIIRMVSGSLSRRDSSFAVRSSFFFFNSSYCRSNSTRSSYQ